MIRRNLVLASAVAAVFGYSSSASAVVNINAATPDPVKISSDVTSPVTIGNETATTDLDATVKVGRSIAKDNGEMYVRFQLSGDAKFAALKPVDLTFQNDPENVMGGIGGVTGIISSGGPGQSYVVYNIKNTDNASPLPITATMTLGVHKVTASDPGDVVKITYSTFGTSSSAYAGTSPTHTASTDYITFTPGFSFSINQDNLTADVEHNFQKFTTGNPYGSLASVSFGATKEVYLPNGLGTDPNVSGYVSKKENAIKIEGDFSFLANAGVYDPGSVFMIKSGDKSACSKNYADELAASPGDIMTTSSITATEVLVNIPEINSAEAVYQLCIKGNEAAEFQFKPSDYVLSFMPQAATNIRMADRLGQPAGKIVRDGTVLDAPFFTLAPGYISRIMLSNFGARDANFTIHLQSDEGSVPTLNTASTLYKVDTEGNGTLSGTIKAGTMLQINATDLVTSFSNKTRGSAKFTIVAPPQNIEGIYQAINMGTGEVSNLHLIHEGGAAEVK